MAQRLQLYRRKTEQELLTNHELWSSIFDEIREPQTINVDGRRWERNSVPFNFRSFSSCVNPKWNHRIETLKREKRTAQIDNSMRCCQNFHFLLLTKSRNENSKMCFLIVWNVRNGLQQQRPSILYRHQNCQRLLTGIRMPPTSIEDDGTNPYPLPHTHSRPTSVPTHIPHVRIRNDQNQMQRQKKRKTDGNLLVAHPNGIQSRKCCCAHSHIE